MWSREARRNPTPPAINDPPTSTASQTFRPVNGSVFDGEVAGELVAPLLAVVLVPVAVLLDALEVLAVGVGALLVAGAGVVDGLPVVVEVWCPASGSTYC